MVIPFHFDRCALCGIERRLIFSVNCPHLSPLHYEPGADGKPQAVLPGAEREGLAKVRASAPMRPRKPQKACDVGLFSDDADQLDLCEMFQDSTEEE